MSKILYVRDELHRRLKLMSTNLNLSMQEATEDAVTKWLSGKEADQEKLLQAFNSIKEKLGPEERKIIETMLAQKNAVTVTKAELSLEESKVLEALLAAQKSGERSK